MADTVTWAQMRALPRVFSANLAAIDVPAEPGIFVWFREGEPVQIGAATGRGGLRRRLSGPPAARSDAPLQVTSTSDRLRTGIARLRASLTNAKHQEKLDAWIAECSVAWKILPDAASAKAAHRELLKDWDPLAHR